MKVDTTGFTDKASKNPDEMQLYLDADDYVTAYSKHTDLRIRRDGHDMAIGGQWEEHGPLQLAFLRQQGMTAKSRLLDFGCGTGRFARIAVPFLNMGKYTGVDISEGALEFAQQLSFKEGWAEKRPTFLKGDGSLDVVKGEGFDFIWLHSVFTHLPPELIMKVVGDLREIAFGNFFFTYKKRPEPLRTGLKQFGYPFDFFSGVAKACGFRAEALGNTWPQGQSCGRVYRA